MRCMASAMREVVAALQPDEQTCQESNAWRVVVFVVWSAKGNCKITRKKWRQVFINHKPESSALVRHRQRDLCGFIHDRCTVESDSV